MSDQGPSITDPHAASRIDDQPENHTETVTDAQSSELVKDHETKIKEPISGDTNNENQLEYAQEIERCNEEKKNSKQSEPKNDVDEENKELDGSRKDRGIIFVCIISRIRSAATFRGNFM